MSGFAWVTLATNDSYSLGALVLAHSLKQVGTAHQLAVLVTPGVTNVMRKNLADVFNVVEEVNLFDSKDEANLRLLKRPELGVTFTKLHCWRLTQFAKCVFLDADVLVLANSDELFEREEFSAAPDVGWPDCFNSGVFVYKPSMETYNNLVDFALQKGSFDGGDQGLLNAYFSDWAQKDISKHLPFIYNMCSTACYSYLPAFKYYGANVKIVHFIGPAKPWLQYFDTESRKVHPSPDLQHLKEVLQKWWDMFCSLIHPKLSPDMSGLAGAFAQFTLGVKRSASQDALENHLRRQAWEVGNIDYMGRDSFDNIWSKICQTLSTTELETAPDKDGAVSSSETHQIPEVKQQVETVTATESQTTPEITAVVEAPASACTVEEKPKDEIKEVAPEVVAQKDEAKSEQSEETVTEVPKLDDDKLQGTDAPLQPVTSPDDAKPESTPTTEVPKSDDKPQEVDVPAQEIKSDVPEESVDIPEKAVDAPETSVVIPEQSAGVLEKPVEASQTVEVSNVEAPQEVVTETTPVAAVESPKVDDQQIVQPDVIPEKESPPEATVAKEEIKSESPEKVEETTTQETVPIKEETVLEKVISETPDTSAEPAATVDTPSAAPPVPEQAETPKTVEQAEQVQEPVPQEAVTKETKLDDVKPDVILSSEVKQEPEVSPIKETPPSETLPPITDTAVSEDTIKLEESKPDVITTAEVKEEAVAPLAQEVPLSDSKSEEVKSEVTSEEVKLDVKPEEVKSIELPSSKEEVKETVEKKEEDVVVTSVPVEEKQSAKEPEQAEIKAEQPAEVQKETVAQVETTKETAAATQIETKPETTSASSITPKPLKTVTAATQKDKVGTAQKEKGTVPTESPKETKPVSPTDTKAPKVVKRVKPKADSSTETGKVQAKPEQTPEPPKPQESPKTEAAIPQASAQAEPTAEASAEPPKPKVKKVKKVKKVVKPTPEAGESPEDDASKK